LAPMKTLKVDHLIGREVGTSTLLKEIGRGSMGIVFLAYQRTLKRQIAVKILPKSRLSPSSAELFRNEAESAAILSHPSIVTIHEVGETEDFFFFTMQLVKGGAVSEKIMIARRNVLPSRRFLPLKTTIETVTKVLDALDYAHRQDIVHRDIKPANVLIESHTNRPIITDFGIAKILRGPDNKSPLSRGTPIYMAPEQILNRHVNGRADIYSTGTMLFEMLVTNLPLPIINSTQELFVMKFKLKDRLFQKRPSEINPMVDKEMDEIVRKAITFDAEKRYPTCREFLECLEAYAARHLREEMA
jgi:serine/threonine protein kinase